MDEPLIPGGCILLARKIIESEIWDKPPLYIKVWIYLLTRAQHGEYKKLKRGQLRTSIPEIIEACSWKVGARIERPTKDQIYQVLEFLRGKAMKSQRSPHESNDEEKMITTTKATQGLLVTIDRYGVYQDIKSYESNDESNDEKETKTERKQRQPDNINKNVKRITNTTADVDFEKLISAYCQIHNKLDINIKSTDVVLMQEVIALGVPIPLIIKIMRQVHQERTARGAQISAFAYYKNVILEAWEREKAITDGVPIPEGVPLSPVALGNPKSKQQQQIDEIDKYIEKEREKRGVGRNSDAIQDD